MAKRSIPSTWQPLAVGIFQPTAVGILLYFGVMSIVDRSDNELLVRYLAGHPVSRMTTALSLIGLVALLQTGLRVFRQLRDDADYSVPATDVPPKEEMVARAIALRDLVGKVSRGSLGFYRQQRLVAATRFVEQTGAADRLDDELKYLSDGDLQRQADAYSFVRILIWAIPMLGFLGTVLGITQALGSIQIGPENDFQQMMNGLRTGLYVAFDTTAQALAFSMALMFVQFIVMRFETQLLEQVDRQIHRDLSGWFDVGSTDGDAYVRTVQRIGRSILAATHEMSQTQMELWRRSIDAAQAAWIEALQANHQLVQQNLSDSIDVAVDRMAQRLADSIQQVDAALERRGQQWQTQLSQMTRQIQDQQQSVLTSSQAVLSGLRGLGGDQSSETQRLLDSVTLNRTLQDLIESLNRFTAQLGSQSSAASASAVDASPSRAAGPVPLRIFKEDLAA
jgi:biopolymer transport protein ExbB/TolQ